MNGMTPGEVIRHYRYLRLPTPTIDAVAKKLKVSPGAVGNWEHDRANPRLHNAVALDDYLGARGAIMAAYGYLTPAILPTTEDLAALAARVEVLEQAVDRVLDGDLDAARSVIASLREERPAL